MMKFILSVRNISNSSLKTEKMSSRRQKEETANRRKSSEKFYLCDKFDQRSYCACFQLENGEWVGVVVCIGMASIDSYVVMLGP